VKSESIELRFSPLSPFAKAGMADGEEAVKLKISFIMNNLKTPIVTLWQSVLIIVSGARNRPGS
jgi:hypothetical protein